MEDYIRFRIQDIDRCYIDCLHNASSKMVVFLGRANLPLDKYKHTLGVRNLADKLQSTLDRHKPNGRLDDRLPCNKQERTRKAQDKLLVSFFFPFLSMRSDSIRKVVFHYCSRQWVPALSPNNSTTHLKRGSAHAFTGSCAVVVTRQTIFSMP